MSCNTSIHFTLIKYNYLLGRFAVTQWIIILVTKIGALHNYSLASSLVERSDVVHETYLILARLSKLQLELCINKINIAGS